MQLFSATLQYFQKKFKLPTKSWKNHPQKCSEKLQSTFFSLLPERPKQTEEFMFQNVAYRPTVYRTGIL